MTKISKNIMRRYNNAMIFLFVKLLFCACIIRGSTHYCAIARIIDVPFLAEIDFSTPSVGLLLVFEWRIFCYLSVVSERKIKREDIPVAIRRGDDRRDNRDPSDLIKQLDIVTVRSLGRRNK